jgi:hypothetical protein
VVPDPEVAYIILKAAVRKKFDKYVLPDDHLNSFFDRLDELFFMGQLRARGWKVVCRYDMDDDIDGRASWSLRTMEMNVNRQEFKGMSIKEALISLLLHEMAHAWLMCGNLGCVCWT